jgi:hypothetical protein
MTGYHVKKSPPYSGLSIMVRCCLRENVLIGGQGVDTINREIKIIAL